MIEFHLYCLCVVRACCRSWSPLLCCCSGAPIVFVDLIRLMFSLTVRVRMLSSGWLLSSMVCFLVLWLEWLLSRGGGEIHVSTSVVQSQFAQTSSSVKWILS